MAFVPTAFVRYAGSTSGIWASSHRLRQGLQRSAEARRADCISRIRRAGLQRGGWTQVARGIPSAARPGFWKHGPVRRKNPAREHERPWSRCVRQRNPVDRATICLRVPWRRRVWPTVVTCPRHTTTKAFSFSHPRGSAPRSFRLCSRRTNSCRFS